MSQEWFESDEYKLRIRDQREMLSGFQVQSITAITSSTVLLISEDIIIPSIINNNNYSVITIRFIVILFIYKFIFLYNLYIVKMLFVLLLYV